MRQQLKPKIRHAGIKCAVVDGLPWWGGRQEYTELLKTTGCLYG